VEWWSGGVRGITPPLPDFTRSPLHHLNSSPLPPAPGEPAPEFEGPTQDGTTLRLSDLRGRPVALYFYPEDETALCTLQACSVRDGTAALRNAGVAVVGVSPDDVGSHAEFAHSHRLDFPLVADPDKNILKAYGTWGDKSLYGRLVTGVKRWTYLIGPDGHVVDVIKRPDVRNHAEQILERFRRAGVVA
jgi:thioredoxin-dependent peroxiredoxin